MVYREAELKKKSLAKHVVENKQNLRLWWIHDLNLNMYYRPTAGRIDAITSVVEPISHSMLLFVQNKTRRNIILHLQLQF